MLNATTKWVLRKMCSKGWDDDAETEIMCGGAYAIGESIDIPVSAQATGVSESSGAI